MGPTPWLTHESRYDAMLDGFGAVAADAVLRPDVRTVLDVGCGTGGFTLELARRISPGGYVVGVDVDPDLIDRARERAWDASASNVTFVVGDAASYPFRPGEFDAIASRFGTMFFADPVGAFRSLGTALSPGGLLTFVCWREPSANAWFSLPMTVAARHVGATPPAPGRPTTGLFALADADHVQRVLRAAGFPDLSLTGIDRMVDVGGDADDAIDFYAATFGAALPADVVDNATADLRGALDAFSTPDGVFLPASAWLVTARRAPASISRQFNHARRGQTSVKR
ncbi:MAG TPA: class I SAM-dependent methyltransferase [Acidimicrobiales bacterium]|nr:class I SAM-dependent methyltransferase [Acidimicrobiales bacterium]